ncbi:MAG: DUF3500 domain-containing protein [Verrucomicrobiales bacterium]
MKARFLLLLPVIGFSPTSAQSHRSFTLTSRVLAEMQPTEKDHSPQSRVLAAQRFLETLTEPQRQELTRTPEDPERRTWTNTPPSAKSGGLRLGDLNETQLLSAYDFLSTILSNEGFTKTRQLMLADDMLVQSEKRALRRGGFGAANFWVVLFGPPSTTEPWGVQVDGHHLALNLTFVGEHMTMSPSFIGTQPHRFFLGSEEILPMEEETRGAFEFMASLDAEQRQAATQGDQRGRIRAGAGKDGAKPDPRGLSCRELTPEQRQKLLKLVSLWIDDMPAPAFQSRRQEIEDQLEDTFFAWYGPHQAGGDASFHLNGPSLILEYAGQNLGGNPRDHLHSIYRDPENEYGLKWTK